MHLASHDFHPIITIKLADNIQLVKTINNTSYRHADPLFHSYLGVSQPYNAHLSIIKICLGIVTRTLKKKHDTRSLCNSRLEFAYEIKALSVLGVDCRPKLVKEDVDFATFLS